MSLTNGRPSLLRSAGTGALAGLIGGAAMTTAERVLLPRIPGRRRPRVPRWDRRIASAAERLGWEMSPRARSTTGIASQLVYATMLGAAYGVASQHLRPSRAGRQLLDAGLMFAASLLAPELPRHKARRRKHRGRVERIGIRALEPVTPSRVFGRTTTLALSALTR